MTVDLILSSQTSYFSRINFKKFKNYCIYNSFGKLYPFSQKSTYLDSGELEFTYIILQTPI